MEAKLEIRNIRKTYSLGLRKVDIFQGLNLHVFPGEFVTICGTSGCGKSTLLLMIAGLEDIDTGAITVDGTMIRCKASQDIGFVFQEPALIPWRNVWRNIAFGLEIRKYLSSEIEGTIKQMLELVGLIEYKDSYPSQLSGGMQQRISLARALAIKPSLLLMDEPFSALDVSTRQKMREELLRIWRETGVTILFVTHDIEEACELGTKIVVFYKVAGNEPTQIEIIEDVTQRNKLNVKERIFELVRGDETKDAQNIM